MSLDSPAPSPQAKSKNTKRPRDVWDLESAMHALLTNWNILARKEGETVLHWSVLNAPDMVKGLIEANADPRDTNYDHKTPAQLCETSNPALSQYLKEHEVAIEIRNKKEHELYLEIEKKNRERIDASRQKAYDTFIRLFEKCEDDALSAPAIEELDKVLKTTQTHLNKLSIRNREKYDQELERLSNVVRKKPQLFQKLMF